MADDLNARAEKLETLADQETPEAWVPANDGEKLTGVLLRMDEGETAYGHQEVAIIERLSGDAVAFWLLHQVARQEWEKADPQPGELVCIRYGGRRQPQGDGKPYAHFRVLVDRGQALPVRETAPAAPPPSPEEFQRLQAAADAQATNGAEDDIPF